MPVCVLKVLKFRDPLETFRVKLCETENGNDRKLRLDASLLFYCFRLSRDVLDKRKRWGD